MERMRGVLLAVVVTVSAVGGMVVAAPAAESAPVLTPTIDRSSKASVTTAYRTSLGEARAVPTGWTGSTATCTKGTESSASIDATRAAVNFYRAMNGLPSITMDPALHSKALAAALMMDAANALSHAPGTSWPCYSAEGADGAASGNLSPYPAASAIDSYLEDAGPDNDFAGHRRQVLYPPATTFGTGSTADYNSLIYGAVGARPSGVSWISWPNEGFIPKTLVKPRFSLSNSQIPDADYSAAAISVKVGSTSLAVTKHPLQPLYGDNTLTWEVALPSDFLTTASDVKFDITVSGIKTAGGAAVPTRSYSSTAYVGEAPSAPPSVTASMNGVFAQVQWPAPVYDGGGAVTGYVVTPYVNGVAQPAEEFGNAPIQFIGPLVNGASYRFKVQAKNAVGTSALSGFSNTINPTGSATGPSVPTAVAGVAGNGQVTVSWTAPAANGGSAVNGYTVVPYLGANAQTERFQSGSATGMTVTGLTNGTAYTFKVRAYNGAGNSQLSTASAPVTPAASATVPGAPTIGSASAGNGQATVSWTAPASNGGSAITGYEITPYANGNAQAPVASSGTGTSKVITGLANGTPYQFRVKAVNAIGLSDPSGASNSVTPRVPATVPGAPTIGSVSAGNGQVSVSWAAPASNGGASISGYQVTPYVGATAQPVVVSTGPGTSKVVTGLANGTAYTFRVAAVNAVGTGAQSGASGAVTPVAPATAPGAPTAVTGLAGNGQVSVSWAAPASNGGSAITGYQVTPYVGATAQPVVTSSGTGTTKVVTGLANGTAYTFRVAAVNAVGTGAQSGASSAVTPMAAIAPYAPFASWSALVTRQYVDLTTKAPTSAQLSSWVSQLNAGTKTKGDLDDALRRGDENLKNVDPVVRIYRAFLGRAPDSGGLKFWINRKRSVAPARTWSVTQIATDFTNSNEFKTKYGSLTNRQFVTQIYTDVLGRAADPSGVNYWTGKLDRKESTKAQVVVGFSESNEYKTKQAQNTDVTIAYVYLLGRSPTTTEASDWVTRQKAGTDHAVLLTELLGSAKYATHITG